MRVLVVEDSERLRRLIGTALRRTGFAVDLAADGMTGLHSAEINDYDVIILDVMLPALDGLSLLRRLRVARRDTHVLLLTAKDTVEDRVNGLKSGADDYLVKPFALEELLARVEALARRRHGVKSPVVEIGDVRVDTSRRTVTRGTTPVKLTAREFALLEYLAARKGAVVSRAEIEAHIYDDRVEPMSNVVDSAVYALRRKLDQPGESSLIRTRRGMGYVLTVDPE